MLLFGGVIVLVRYVQRSLRSSVKDLSHEYVDEFIRQGIVVIPGVLSETEVFETRKKFHEYLKKHGCIASNLLETANSLSTLSSTWGAGGILDVFYEEWKLKVNEHPKVVATINLLLQETYAKNLPHFTHPYGNFDPEKSLMYIDRVCFRVPDLVSQHFRYRKKNLQRSLTPHLDCCPHQMYNSSKEYPKWRPIQAFVALTDTLNLNEGGFEAHPGFHLQFENWAATRKPSPSRDQPNQTPPCVGEFTPIRPIEDKEVLRGVTHIPCRAGDLVCWDYRIPHANSRRNDKITAREVIYVGILPSVNINIAYAQNQLRRYREGKVPVDQWHEHSGSQPCDYNFSPLGKKLMTITDY